ncbi:transposase [Leclercia pneumoniae]|uniref:transposase n=1 Tax=Leclercia pneumoniae TaxID=2815358 RepID=UPI003AF52EE3
MGFWKTAGQIAKGAANALEKQVNEMQATKMRLESKNSDDLKRLIKSEGFFGSPSSIEKSVAVKILKERGDA